MCEVYDSFRFLHNVAKVENVNLEWRKQATEESDELNTDHLLFWRNRMNQRNIQGKLKYPNLRKVIGCLMSLPFAIAPVERLFSDVNHIKMNTETV